MRTAHTLSLRPAAILFAAALTAAGPVVRADVIDNGRTAEDAVTHHSFVRFWDAATNKPGRLYFDTQYIADVKAALITSVEREEVKAVDIVMQQCYGGGFRNDVAGALTNYTFAAACDWDEVAYNSETRNGETPPRMIAMNNFTRAWRENAESYNGLVHPPQVAARPLDGMRLNFKAARDGTAAHGNGPAVAKDIYQPASSVRNKNNTADVECHGVYQSPGAAGVTGADDDRGMGNPAGGVRYAILVAWDKQEARHEVNMARMYDTLWRFYGIPTSRIVLLDSGHPRSSGADITTRMGPWAAMGPTDITGLRNWAFPAAPTGWFVDSPTTPEGWVRALTAQLYGGNTPGANDTVLIYNTGHGGAVEKVEFKTGNAGRTRTEWVVPRMASNLADPSNLDASTVVDDDGTVTMQISAGLGIEPGVHFVFNGHDLGSFGDNPQWLASIADPNAVLTVAPVSPDQPFTYRVAIPLNYMIDTLEPHNTIRFEGSDPRWTADSITAFDLRGGDAEMLAYVAPKCPADVDDGSGTGKSDDGVTIEDLLYYLSIFADGGLAADLDDGSGTGARDGSVTIDDLLFFLDHFSQGC